MSRPQEPYDVEKGPGGQAPTTPAKGTLDDKEKKSLEGSLDTRSNVCCSMFGHDFHWTELFFMVMFVIGVFLTSYLNAGGKFPAVLIVLFGAATAFVAFAYVWNLCPSRLLAAITAKLAMTVEKFSELNKKALANCKSLAEGNVELKGHVGTLGETRKMFKKTSFEMGEVDKKNEEIARELEDRVQQRANMGKKLKEILDLNASNATGQAILNLTTSILGQVKEREMKSGASAELQLSTLETALKVENIDFSREEFKSKLRSPSALKGYDHYELFLGLEDHITAHFRQVDAAYCEYLVAQQQLATLRKQTKANYQIYLEERAEAYEDQLNSFLKDPKSSMSSAVSNIVGQK